MLVRYDGGNGINREMENDGVIACGGCIWWYMADWQWLYIDGTH